MDLFTFCYAFSLPSLVSRFRQLKQSVFLFRAVLCRSVGAYCSTVRDGDLRKKERQRERQIKRPCSVRISWCNTSPLKGFSNGTAFCQLTAQVIPLTHKHTCELARSLEIGLISVAAINTAARVLAVCLS